LNIKTITAQWTVNSKYRWSVPYLKVIFRHLPGGNKENNEIAQDSWCLIEDLNPERPEYNSVLLLLLLLLWLLLLLLFVYVVFAV